MERCTRPAEDGFQRIKTTMQDLRNEGSMIKGALRHFSRIASRYQELRMTDIAPVLAIRERLKGMNAVAAADVGCGTGRYSLCALETVPNIGQLYCFDANDKMLAEMENSENCQAIVSRAEHLPLLSGALDCLFTFNAVHHFQLPLFAKEASRVLMGGGFLFIYTRLRQQNAGHIWGRYFPHFFEKETRLYDLDAIVSSIGRVSTMKVNEVITFTHKRVSTLARLRELAREKHYSTFDFYSSSEFKRALAQFERNLRERFEDLNDIPWVDENTLLIIRKADMCA